MIYKEIELNLENYSETGKLRLYLLDAMPSMQDVGKRPLVLICPGGGYEKVSKREGEPIAMRFLAMGYHAAVLQYSVSPSRYPLALLQLASAVAYLKEHAGEYQIDPEKIVIQGCSAGGHLAACLGVFWNRSFISEKLQKKQELFRPAGMILCYPVISSGEFAHKGSFENLLGEQCGLMKDSMSLETQVTEATPRAFIWHSQVDKTVPVENSLLFYQALHKNNISAELHIYPVGEHGIALANFETSKEHGFGIQEECQSWIMLAEKWMKRI